MSMVILVMRLESIARGLDYVHLDSGAFHVRLWPEFERAIRHFTTPFTTFAYGSTDLLQMTCLCLANGDKEFDTGSIGSTKFYVRTYDYRAYQM